MQNSLISKATATTATTATEKQRHTLGMLLAGVILMCHPAPRRPLVLKISSVFPTIPRLHGIFGQLSNGSQRKRWEYTYA
jgi:hypothetical protein